MADTFRSARLYFWPIIAANVFATTLGAGGDFRRMALLALILCGLSSFGFLLNDLSDRAIDLVNEAGHFEHASIAALRLARVLALGFLLFALGAGWALGPRVLGLSAGLALGLTVYSPILRRAAFVPNVATAVFASSPIWTPLLLSPHGGAIWQWWLVSAFIVMLTGREILMDVRDRPGDAMGGRRTLATELGPRRSAGVGVMLTWISTAPFCLAVTFAVAGASPFRAVVAVAIAGGILYLINVPASRIQAPGIGDTTPAIQAYVLSSRLAMALMPALVLVMMPWS